VSELIAPICDNCRHYCFGMCRLFKPAWFDRIGMHPKEEGCFTEKRDE